MTSLAGWVALGTVVLYSGAIYVAIRLLFTLRDAANDPHGLHDAPASDRH